jgi:hypothetical protein
MKAALLLSRPSQYSTHAPNERGLLRELRHHAMMAVAYRETTDPSHSVDRHLSTFEMISTEIIQQVASYPIREDHDDVDTNR